MRSSVRGRARGVRSRRTGVARGVTARRATPGPRPRPHPARPHAPRAHPARPARLPRAIEADPALAERVAGFLARGAPLWRAGELVVPRAPLGDALALALRRARRAGELVRGLEGAERALADEEKGLRLAARAGGPPRGARISRLLLLSDDGAERFYRHAETLLRRHAPRLVAVRLTTDADTLGGLLFGPGRPARAVLLERKEAVAAALHALAEAGEAPTPGPADSAT
jgi:hypothetical protein